MKIGFLDRTQANWTAGASYTRSMVHALANASIADCEVHVLGGRTSSLAELPAGAKAIRFDADVVSLTHIQEAVEAHGLDVLLPVTEALLPQTACALVGWIPDFQHRHLPEYFSDEELSQRDRYFGYLVDNCDAMMFSSEAVLADFRALYPSYAGASGCAHFPSSFAYARGMTEGDPRFVSGKYGLPRAFVLVANQFWKHKNHRLVVEAVALARRLRPDVHVVMVGVPNDTRDPRNSHISELFGRLSVEKLFQNISVLGEVPLPDLIALMRCAIEVVQPSRFEGWNTTIEDSLALGKRVACSDIESNREQAPGAFFFPCYDAGPLAGHLQEIDWSCGGWSGVEAERASLQLERERGKRWAYSLIEICREAIECRRRSAGVRAGWSGYDPEDEIRKHPLLHLDHLQTQNEYLRRRLDALREQWTERARLAREKAGEDRLRLKEKVAEATHRAESLAEELWREKSTPMRVRLRDEMLRRLGRGGRARSH
ncbi:MAG: glycosyltransferase [Terrimicrobiaceae bacterium]|nr:glycosyltransferase [Terrimicrobiaceae bacterium]